MIQVATTLVCDKCEAEFSTISERRYAYVTLRDAAKLVGWAVRVDKPGLREWQDYCPSCKEATP